MTLAPTRTHNRMHLVLVAALLVVLSFAAFGVNLKGAYIWDDDLWLTRNEAVTHPDISWIWTHTHSATSYCPLTLTTFWVEYRLWGLWAPGYRVVNILLHATSAFLLWRILSKIKMPGALLAAVVWAIHPLQVESVVWITERKNTLSGVFFFASLLLWLRVIRAENSRRRWTAYAGTVVLLVMALLSKPATVFMPVAALALAWLDAGSLRIKHILWTVPLFAAAMAMAALTVYMDYHFAAQGYGPDWDLSAGQRIILAGHCFWFYIIKVLWPIDLATFYPKWELNSADVLSFIPAASALLALAIAALAAWRLRRKEPLCVLGVYLAGIFPIIGFLKFYTQIFTYVADHFAYLPSAALIAACACLLTKGWHTLRGRASRLPAWLAPTASGALILSLTVLSFAQASVYQTHMSFWSEAIRANPKAAAAYNSIGDIYYSQNQYDEAIRYYEKAISLQRHPLFLANLGILLDALGQPEKARGYYEEAVARRTVSAVPYRRLAAMELAAGNPDRAIAICRQALTISADWYPMWIGIGMIHQQNKRYDQAIEAYQNYLQHDPRSADTYFQLGVMAEERGQYDLAAKHYREVIGIKSDHLIARRKLAAVLAQSGKAEDARREATIADEIETGGKSTHTGASGAPSK